MQSATLITVRIFEDINDRGEKAWMVCPVYERDGDQITVPDHRGWPTRREAEREARRIVMEDTRDEQSGDT